MSDTGESNAESDDTSQPKPESKANVWVFGTIFVLIIGFGTWYMIRVLGW